MQEFNVNSIMKIEADRGIVTFYLREKDNVYKLSISATWTKMTKKERKEKPMTKNE